MLSRHYVNHTRPELHQKWYLDKIPTASDCVCRTVARKSSIGGIYVRAGGHDIQIWQRFH